MVWCACNFCVINDDSLCEFIVVNNLSTLKHIFFFFQFSRDVWYLVDLCAYLKLKKKKKRVSNIIVNVPALSINSPSVAKPFEIVPGRRDSIHKV